MKLISMLWVQKLKVDERNFNDVPAKLRDEVMQKLTEDGYTVDDEGQVVKIE